MPSLVHLFALCAQLSFISLHASALPTKRDGTTAVVHWSSASGTPQHYAAGILYGVPDTANQIPDQFYSDIDLQYVRAGGAQVLAPGRGWIWGETEYENRFASVLSNYRTARQHGAGFVFLPHDLWGADSTQNSSAPYPGDNGDWTYYDSYLTRLFSDMNANSMVDGLVWDTWNEPDLGTVFWGRSQQQYLEMWGYTHAKVKAAFPGMIISGPSSSSEPGTNNGWYTTFASFVKSNGTEPDQWSWHMETGGDSSMDRAYAGHQAVLAQYGLTGGSTPVNINEYAVFDEQVAANAAWWIAQLERANAFGLRGNWLSTTQLHDFMASLLSKPGAPDQYSATGTGYYPNGEYQVYKYYATNMTGTRVATDASSDLALDVYATYDTEQNKARILVGTRQVTGTWYVQLNDLTALGLPASGTLNILTHSFVDNGHYGQVGDAADLGYVAHPYSDGSVSFPIYQNDKTTAYAFEFDLV